jgi:aldose sugar dehydrogenase
LNIIRAGLNYGWSIICHGIDYNGQPIGDGIKEKEGMEQPIYFYTPSIAPSGMEFYTVDKFPKWKNNLFIGAMAKQHLNRLVIENNEVVYEERVLEDLKRRVRCIKQGPDGYLYIGVYGGKILRLMPEYLTTYALTKSKLNMKKLNLCTFDDKCNGQSRTRSTVDFCRFTGHLYKL